MDIEYNNDHNVYILGAGFSYEAGYPLVRNFMDKMREAAVYAQNSLLEVNEIEAVLKFRLEAASAAYRVPFDPENVEDLFSLSAATENTTNIANRNMVIAIAKTLEYCRSTGNKVGTLTFPGVPDPIPKGFDLEKKDRPFNLVIDKYEFYVGFMAGVWGETPNNNSTFITFNYDLLLEKSLQRLGLPFRYDGLHETDVVMYDESAKELEDNANLKDVVSLLKLHGSVNWALAPFSIQNSNKPIRIYQNFEDVPIYPWQGVAQELLLAPPVWDKGTSRIGHPLSGIWSNAIKKLQTATRIIVIGYSLPLADAHFRYLMAAGLQHNISLREIVFVNPAFREGDPDKEALEERIFSVFRRDLHQKGILKLLPHTAHEFFHQPNIEEILGRRHPVPFSQHQNSEFLSNMGSF